MNEPSDPRPDRDTRSWGAAIGERFAVCNIIHIFKTRRRQTGNGKVPEKLKVPVQILKAENRDGDDYI